jgi:hypothetical protein
MRRHAIQQRRLLLHVHARGRRSACHVTTTTTTT